MNWELREPGQRSDLELLEQALGSTQVAAALLSHCGSLAALLTLRENDLVAFPGIGGVGARRLVATIELARRAATICTEQPHLRDAPTIVAYMEPHVRGLEIEKFWVLCVNAKNRLIRRVEVTSGTATSALAHPREVFRAAIKESATAIICVHNHPSGDPSPSANDLMVTRQLAEAAKAVDIELLDHVVIGRPGADPCGLGYYSFRNSGLL